MQVLHGYKKIAALEHNPYYAYYCATRRSCMIWQLSDWIMRKSTFARRSFSRVWYWFVSKMLRDEGVGFMNYGYMETESEDGRQHLVLDEDDEINRFPAQLYHHLAEATDLRGRHVLEVGSGRGGGAAFVVRYHKPATYTGVDLAENAVGFCTRNYRGDGLSFKVGDAADLPEDDRSKDAVLNVESSHCYTDMEKFVDEVYRVLKPDGYFLYADLGSTQRMDDVKRIFLDRGFSIIREKNINDNVVRSLDQLNDTRLGTILKFAPWFARRLAKDFAGVQGSPIYNALVSGKTRYMSYVLQK